MLCLLLIFIILVSSPENLRYVSHWPLQEKLSEQLEEQRQEQALQRYHSEAEELDNWLLSTRATLSSALQPQNEDMDMEEQLIDCQVTSQICSKETKLGMTACMLLCFYQRLKYLAASLS